MALCGITSDYEVSGDEQEKFDGKAKGKLLNISIGENTKHPSVR